MCNNGGILGMDACQAQVTIHFSQRYNTSSFQWDRADTINDDNFIHIFDSARPYEGVHDAAYALITNPDYVDAFGRHFVEIRLKQSIGGSDYPLQHDYYASAMQESYPFSWTFDEGNSAGACVDDNLFYQADPTNLPQPFSDGFVTYHWPAYGSEGSGVVAYMPAIKIGALPDRAAATKHHQIWYANKQPFDCYLDQPDNTQPCPQCCNYSHNHNHILGLKMCDLTDIGDSIAASDISWVFISAIAADCSGCTGNQLPNYIREVTCHECGHQFNINCPPDYHDMNDAWCGMCSTGITQKCIMNLSSGLPDRTDGVDKFCADNLLHDPISCGPSVPSADSIRTTLDPL
jgi:hypothetical protein